MQCGAKPSPDVGTGRGVRHRVLVQDINHRGNNMCVVLYEAMKEYVFFWFREEGQINNIIRMSLVTSYRKDLIKELRMTGAYLK